MSAKLVTRLLGLTLALGALAALYVAVHGRSATSDSAAKKENPAAEEKACGEGCWLPFF